MSPDDPPRWKCTQCGTPTDGVLKVCQPCLDAGIEPLKGGHWVTVKGIRRYVPWTAEECAQRAEAARVHLRRERVKALLRERYGPSDWWKQPLAIPVGPQTAGPRVAAMVADFDRHDARMNQEREVA